MEAVDSLLAWGTPRLRDLPWRATRDPWMVLVSEVMLQQTQVERVEQRWGAFVERYPNPQVCASARLGDVLRSWHGLGYPRRAANLHLAAQLIAAAGRFPCDLDGLLALPGVGPYTARAVLAFAFDTDAAVVDTNIARVYARVEGRRLNAREVQESADALAPSGQAWIWNQCLMDLGATVCRARAPDCGACPWAQRCAWTGIGDDPAAGSAGVSRRQARFAGSDREARGRILARLIRTPATADQLAVAADRSPVTAVRLLAALVAEGLVVGEDRGYQLP